jgi:hypothetical protein
MKKFPKIDPENFANHIVDGWDMDSLVGFAVETLTEEFKKMSAERLYEEYVNYHGKHVENEFSNLEIGERFFDPESGECWIKTTNDSAKIDSGTDSTEEDKFLPHDIVIVEWE